MQKRKKLFIAITAIVTFVVASCSLFFLFRHFDERKKQAEQARLVQQYYENKLALYQTENELYDDYTIDVAFLGDSLTDGYNLAEFYPQYTTSNRGIGGETTHGLERRLQLSVYDLKPKIAVLLIGGNNLNTMFENYENILIGLRDNLPQTKIILVSLTAMGRDWAHKNKTAAYNNVIIKKLAGKYGFNFVDLYTPLFDETLGEIHPDYTTDGAHLTPLGYQVFTETLTPIIDDLLK